MHELAATACVAPTYAPKRLLELVDERPLEHVAVLERDLHGAELLRPEQRPRNRDPHVASLASCAGDGSADAERGGDEQHDAEPDDEVASRSDG